MALTPLFTEFSKKMQSLKNTKSIKVVGPSPKLIKPYKSSRKNTIIFILLVILLPLIAFKLEANTRVNEPIQSASESATLQPTPTIAPLFSCDPFTSSITDGKITKTCIDPKATPTPTPAQKRSLKPSEFLEANILPITREYGIPDALVASQYALEGGRVTSNPQNNFFGLMRNGQLIFYPSIEANVRDYALTIKNILKAKNYFLPMNKDEIILALQSGDKPRYEGHNADPLAYVYTIKSLPEWEL